MGKSFLADIPWVAGQGHGIINVGTIAAIASNGANAKPGAIGFVAHADMRLVAAWKHNLSAAEVTAGTAISSASYRAHYLANGGTAGTATARMATLLATASAAASGLRAFSVDSTVTIAAGEHVHYSQATVGAATADGTDAAACGIQVAYALI